MQPKPNTKVRKLMTDYELEAIAAVEIGDFKGVDKAYDKVAALKVPEYDRSNKDRVLFSIATLVDNAIPDDMMSVTM